MNKMIDSKWFEMQEAAAAIGCTTGYVRQLLRKGDLEGIKVGERAWLVEKISVAKFNKKPKKTGRPRVVDGNSRKTA